MELGASFFAENGFHARGGLTTRISPQAKTDRPVGDSRLCAKGANNDCWQVFRAAKHREAVHGQPRFPNGQ